MNHFLVLALCFAQTLLAWEETGHRTVGEIASRHLSDSATKAVQGILGKETLAEASTWADEIRSEPAHNYQKPWHYIEIPAGKSLETMERNPKGDILKALTDAKQQLSKPDTSAPERKQALRWLVHLMGDLHQPLHVGTGSDAGANLCAVFWMGSKTTLHSVWDHCLIDSMKLSFTELANFLDTEDPKKILELGKGDFVSYLKETAQLRDAAYPASPGSATPNDRSYCRKDFDSPFPKRAKQPHLSYEYRHRHWPTIQQQLRLAGYRLAFQLNAIFSEK